MIRSQQIALRCAAAMPNKLLFHHWADHRRERYMEKFSLTVVKQSHLLTRAVMDQLDRCASDCARRLLLGVSEQFEIEPVSRVAEKVRRVA